LKNLEFVALSSWKRWQWYNVVETDGYPTTNNQINIFIVYIDLDGQMMG